MFGRNKEKAEQTEKKRGTKNMETKNMETKNMEAMNKNGQQLCPCCDRHCPVDRLHCANGKKHFGLPTDGQEERGHGQEERGHGQEERGHGQEERGHGQEERGHGQEERGHGQEEHRRRREEAGADAHGPEKHGGRERRPAQADESEMSPSEITYALLRRCGHYLHHTAGGESPDAMFAALSEEEKKELNGLLRKIIKSWKEN